MERDELVKEVAIRVGTQVDTFETKNDLLQAARRAMDELGVTDKKARRVIATAVRFEPEYVAALKAVLLRECEGHRPISGESLLEHLPLPMRVFNSLRRSGLVTVFDLLSRLAREGTEGLLKTRDFGQGALEDSLKALSWAEPIKLNELQLDEIALKLIRRLVRDQDLVGYLLSLEEELEEESEVPSAFIPLDEEQIGRANALIQFPEMTVIKGCLSPKNQVMVVLMLENQPEHCLGEGETFGGFATIPLTPDQISYLLVRSQAST